MTKRDFFITAIKLFGLYSLVVSLFSLLPSTFTFALFDLDFKSIIWLTIVMAVVFALFFLLVFKAGKVADMLELSKGFDDDRINLSQLNSSIIIKTGTFIIGGLMFLDNIPMVLSHLFFLFKGTASGFQYSIDDKVGFVTNIIAIILGYLMITHLDFVAKLFKSGQENKSEIIEKNN